MAYRVKFTRAAARQIRRLPRQIQSRIDGRIADLAQEPRPSTSQRLRATDLYRTRIGN